MKTRERKSNPGWELRVESQIKKKFDKSKNTKRNIKRFGRNWTQNKFEETCQKILAKEERLNRYWAKTKQYRQNWTFQNNEKNSTNNWGRIGEAISTTECERGEKILEQNMGTEKS